MFVPSEQAFVDFAKFKVRTVDEFSVKLGITSSGKTFCLLVFGSLMYGCGGGGGSSPSPTVAPTVPSTPTSLTPIRFTQIHDAGFNRQFPPELDGLTDPERFGGGVAAGDIDNDGDIDLYIVGRDLDPNHLYENQGNGRFFEIGSSVGVDVRHWGSGPAFGDIDGDGDLDLFVGAVENYPIYLFENRLNETEARFVDITTESGISTTIRNTVSALFYDYDRDGYVDLFLAHWGQPYEDGFDTGTIWRNNGDRTFSTRSVESGIASALPVGVTDWSFTPAFSDIDRDGDGDLFMASDFEESQIFLNNDDGTFTRITDREVIKDQNGMGSALGDYDNDGDMDWFVTSIYDLDSERGRYFGNRMYENRGGGLFRDVTLAANVQNGEWGWGTCAGDFDNDGHLDLVEVNGWITSDHKDFRNRPVFLYYNLGQDRMNFVEVHEEANLTNTGQGRALSCFDADRDGDLDIVLVNGSPDHIVYYRNDTVTGNNYLRIRLAGLGTNRYGVGARIEVTSSDGTQIREMGSNNNFTSHDPLESHFGLGNATSADVLVTWPDQTTSELENVRANQSIRVVAETRSLRVVVTNGTGTGTYGLGEGVSIKASEPEEGYFFSHWSGDDSVVFADRYGSETTFPMPRGTVSVRANYVPGISPNASVSVARRWIEVLLQAIRNDYARPTVHARNLFHVSSAMYDVWAVHQDVEQAWLLGSNQANSACGFIRENLATQSNAARDTAISMAAYRIIRHRFQNSPGASRITRDANALLDFLDLDKDLTTEDYSEASGAGLGNYVASCYIDFGNLDGANEVNGYRNLFYVPVNPPLRPHEPGNPDIVDLNRWQPLSLRNFVDQAGNPDVSEPEFISPEWGSVWPFALSENDLKIHQRDGNDYWVYHDPGPPPKMGESSEDFYKWGFELVAHWGAHLDPTDGVSWDASPQSIGNIDVESFPKVGTQDEYNRFYNDLDGGDIGIGYLENPSTGTTYDTQLVPRGDYTRALAEFWADGPDSETPPGHWFVILNEVNDHPQLERKFEGQGEELDHLEWDVKAYFALGGAMHDAAITAWGIKGWYDYIRPVSAIRALAGLGQRTNEDGPSYNSAGIALLDGYVELVTAGDPLAGTNSEHVDKIKVQSWRGPDFVDDPTVDVAGVGWILAENWWPYQRPSFVTPPFAGYVSGHSTYSRAAAEVLTALTGSKYFPGGMSSFEIPKDTFLKFEKGPTVDMKLEWATYYDASDQCSLSRIWGGIHPPADDIPGRLIGIKVGQDAFRHAKSYFENND